MDLAGLAEMLQTNIEKIQAWYDEKIGALDAEQAQEDATIDETYGDPDEYAVEIAAAKEKNAAKYDTKRNKASEKLNEKLEAAQAMIDEKIAAFNTAKLEEEAAAAEEMANIEADKLKKALEYKLKM